ncbi:DUF3667 domain-containing protein [Psychroserpens sp. AS72]|uniref:DUF3667 domain-containing protein n=1 Tax=Psychroserpens sp. AS72 TaxID=3135775 RepID=UPI00317B7576
MTCISCNHNHDENYCPNCGERNGIKKITFNSIIEDAFSTITNMDKGFLFNLKALFLNPREITTNFIQGKRKWILNPISYLIISITLYIIVVTVLKTPRDIDDIRRLPKDLPQKIGYEAGYFIAGHLKYYWIFTIIPFGLSIKVVFNKFNFLENVAVSSFVIGQATLIGIISYVLLKVPLLYDPVVYFAIAWMIYRIFKGKDKIESALLASAVMVLFVFQLFLLIILIGWIKA